MSERVSESGQEAYGAGDGAGAEQVAHAQRAPGDRVVRDHLPRRPVQVLHAHTHTLIRVLYYSYCACVPVCQCQRQPLVSFS